MHNGKVVRFAPPVTTKARRFSDATLRYEAAKLMRMSHYASGEVTTDDEEEEEDNTKESICELFNDHFPEASTIREEMSVSSTASTEKLDNYIKAALNTSVQPRRRFPLKTTFTTIGPASKGTRRRIRFRHNQKTSDVYTDAGDYSNEDDPTKGKSIITAPDLYQIRERAWKPRLYDLESIEDSKLFDLNIPYQHAWEIGRRGSIAFQAIKWTILGTWFPQTTTRFLILDGTDPVYRYRYRTWSPLKVFTAYDLLKAEWDAGGSFRITYVEKDNEVTEEYFDISQAFVSACLTCLREMAVWTQVTKHVDLTKVYNESQGSPTRRNSTMGIGIPGERRAMSKFIQVPILQISFSTELGGSRDGFTTGGRSPKKGGQESGRSGSGGRRRRKWLFLK